MRLSSFLVAAVFAALTFGIWGYWNRPLTKEPHWPTRVLGFSFQPYQANQDATKGEMPSEAQIDADLTRLSGKTNAVRTYSTLGTLAQIPRLAAKHRIKVAVGAWLDQYEGRNREEINNAIELAHRYRRVVRLIVGNEAILRGDLTAEKVIEYLDQVRAVVRQPVSTAEPWHVWLKYPELGDHVDYIAVHMLPYWEGVRMEDAVDYIDDKMKKLKAAFPNKPIIITEVGWPSQGRTREGAVASTSNEALFLRRFLARANREHYVYYVMEAFDQPWKGESGSEGGVGAYWGVYDANRNPKFEFAEPIVRIPEWHVLAGISVAIAALLLGIFFVNSGTLGTRGRTLLAVVVYATATITVWVIYDYTQQYLTVTSVVVGAFLVVGMLGVIAVLLAEAHEWAEAHWATSRRRELSPGGGDAAHRPKVSIHVPAYNEPPDMLIQTIDALARLDYPDYEVLVIDNNTKDEAVWRPVEAHCAKLGERFRFFHVSPLAGFKAGALNFALKATAADAQIVAVIDSDYKVEPQWLKELVPAFASEKMAIVQAPQDYRDEEENAFKAMCYAEYRGFFQIGMVTRNERNAIIQHGTMTLVRRQVLDEVGGWAEWCITEDAELGLRIFEAGYEATYVPFSYGRGLMPDTYIDFKKQRFRWAYGSMQILRHHAGALLGRSGLTSGQRYHFLAGWLPWIADGFNLIFNVAAIGWSIGMVAAPHDIDPPLMIFSVLPLSLFTFKLVKLMHLYVSRVRANLRQTVAAALAGLALSHTIGVAILKGLITRNEPFFRTPKQAQPHRFAKALVAARTETALMLALWGAAFIVTKIPEEVGSPDLAVWMAVLLIQSIPYAASLLLSLASAFPLPARLLGNRLPNARPQVGEVTR